jgi:hypothetical protein
VAVVGTKRSMERNYAEPSTSWRNPMSERKYHNIDGNPVSLYQLVQTEPNWAANRIAALEAKLEKAREDVERHLGEEGASDIVAVAPDPREAVRKAMGNE